MGLYNRPTKGLTARTTVLLFKKKANSVLDDFRNGTGNYYAVLVMVDY